MVNKQGQTRLSRYFKPLVSSDKTLLEAELIRRCLGRGEDECNFLEIREHKVVYRRYASLYFIVGTRDTQDVNELGLLEFVHLFVETMDKYFENVCELDIMFNIEKVHMILAEMLSNGHIVETNKSAILSPLVYMDRVPSQSNVYSALGSMFGAT
ncbi:MAG: uncharacterized protein KVP18_003388 [Porospora cf. gigantea A]|uniref:uncharacterized protein n=2 Tax=Porospora cf. gigantea A TaxID=2853593 RepID=UPI0035595133|nr:MAG: hypothetical protein KVP18_003388 [Porospora cf. gigantea A]